MAKAVARFGHRLPANTLTTHHRRTLQDIAACRTPFGRLRVRDRLLMPTMNVVTCVSATIAVVTAIAPSARVSTRRCVSYSRRNGSCRFFIFMWYLPCRMNSMNGLCMYNPCFMYGLLLEAGWHISHSFGCNSKWLGARTVATMVRHTWDRTCLCPSHIHCIMPIGGLHQNGK